MLGLGKKAWGGWLVGILVPAALVILAGLASPAASPDARTLPGVVLPDRSLSADGGLSLSPSPTSPALSLRRVEASLRRGETLAEALQGLGLDSQAVHRLAESISRFVDPRQLRPGFRYIAQLAPDGEVVSFELDIEGRGVVSAAAEGESWTATWRAFERSLQKRSIRGRLDGAFESAVEKAGGPSDLAYSVADVLQWDLDFNRDLRAGDQFEVLFEEVFLEGRRFALGSILAVRYLNRGRWVEAYRFGSGEYFDGEGRPLQKMFLRSPIPYSRVTSRFTARRFHPVLKVALPHYGVDYGAPEGTPARATASGVVAFVGWDGGGGKTVKLRHPNGFLTGYLHLSRFAAGLKVGDRVAQSEVIGFVGSTGLATGPHLDYRVQQNGRWLDPLSLNRVPADPVPTARLGEFRALRDAMRASLEPALPPPGSDTRPNAIVASRRPLSEAPQTAGAVAR